MRKASKLCTISGKLVPTTAADEVDLHQAAGDSDSSLRRLLCSSWHPTRAVLWRSTSGTMANMRSGGPRNRTEKALRSQVEMLVKSLLAPDGEGFLWVVQLLAKDRFVSDSVLQSA